MVKYNGAGYITAGVFMFVLGATAMFIVNVYLNPIRLLPYQQAELCGPPAPISLGLVDYKNIVHREGDRFIVHGPIYIEFIDANTIPCIGIPPDGEVFEVGASPSNN